MGPLTWIIFGLFIGVVSKWFVRGNPRLGCLGTVFLGIFGSLVGGTIWNVLTGSGVEVQPGGVFMSVIGAVIVLSVATRMSSSPRT